MIWVNSWGTTTVRRQRNHQIFRIRIRLLRRSGWTVDVRDKDRTLFSEAFPRDHERTSGFEPAAAKFREICAEIEAYVLAGRL